MVLRFPDKIFANQNEFERQSFRLGVRYIGYYGISCVLDKSLQSIVLQWIAGICLFHALNNSQLEFSSISVLVGRNVGNGGYGITGREIANYLESELLILSQHINWKESAV